jgi:hypothetical protein
MGGIKVVIGRFCKHSSVKESLESHKIASGWAD